MSFLPKTRGGVLWRALLACVLVMAFAAGTTAVAGLLKVKDIVNDLHAGAESIKGITLPQPGQPETLLLVGSDHRAGTSFASSNTDTMLLVRIDDKSQTINLMSIPRDLAVLDAGGGTVKLNSIYSDQGGDSGLVQTLKSQVFPGLQINHVIDLNFVGFSDLVDAIGCVYADVDHRYYNLSGPGGNDFSSIDIEPGYQKLCGGVYSNTGTNSALAFVRFRHTDSDKVRNARQQDFIRWAKDGYSTNDLLNNEGKLIKIFGQHVTTDKFLASTDGLIDLFNLIVNADKLTLKTIQFPENFGPCGNGNSACYVYPCVTEATCTGATDSAPTLGEATAPEEQAYKTFITPTKAPAAATTTTTPTTPKRKVVTRKLSLAGLTADPSDGKSQAAQLGNVGIPVYYPKYIQAGSQYCFSLTEDCIDPAEPDSAYVGSYPRKYLIHGFGSSVYKSYAMTIMINADEGWYSTVQGTSWRNAPILSEPSKIVHIAGKKLIEYDDGSKISMVAYYTRAAVYWISNTLDNHIPNGQMLAIASSLTPAGR
jgi:polyisoprenyl-teichoic acid--peptidoglycan teichoic acid transferase